MAQDPNKTDYWRGHVTAWRASGLTQRAYCAQHDLPPHRLTYWVHRLPAPVAGLTLIPLEHATSPGLTLHGRTWRIDFTQPPAADWLAHLLERLP